MDFIDSDDLNPIDWNTMGKKLMAIHHRETVIKHWVEDMLVVYGWVEEEIKKMDDYPLALEVINLIKRKALK